MSYLRQTPIQLILIMLLVFCFGSSIPALGVQISYTVSVFLKDCLLWILPVAVASFIAATLLSFRQKAALFVIMLLLFEALSNASSVIYAYLIGNLSESFIPAFHLQKDTVMQIDPLWSLSELRPAFWASDKAVLIGAVLGLIGAYCGENWLSRFLMKAREYSGLIFSKIFVRLVPLYVLGFVMHLQYSGLLQQIIQSYSFIILLLIGTILVYLSVLLVLTANFKKQRFTEILKNIWPTGVIAFTSMSSAATMPFTIAAAEKNLKNPDLAGMIIPATTNIQQVGDCIANALLCLVILKNFGHPIPNWETWIVFTLVFTLARYTTAGVLGGAIFIMIPIYEKYLGFTPEMVAVILALNVVLDPLITSSNVLANGTLCVLIEKVWNKTTSLFKQKSPASS